MKKRRRFDQLNLLRAILLSSRVLNYKLTSLKRLFQIPQELFSVRPVDDAMIKGQRKISHVTYSDIIVALFIRNYLRAFYDGADAKDRDLRLIDNWRPKKSAKDPGICDCKRAAGNIIRL